MNLICTVKVYWARGCSPIVGGSKAHARVLERRQCRFRPGRGTVHPLNYGFTGGGQVLWTCGDTMETKIMLEM